jgi:integrase
MVKFWRATNSERIEFGALLKLLLLTGCRLNELAGMRRTELNDDGTVWTIPGERTKNKRTHVVPLAPAGSRPDRRHAYSRRSGFHHRWRASGFDWLEDQTAT